ncbi:MAG: hypothetical protein II952_01325 [Paludibacteraceae bacterium]|nr:hypothetical protein [Paludibacteraceae bacterium]
MSEIITSSGIDKISGKLNGRDSGYFYMRNGKQFYRTRAETYQKNQSPRQKWNSAAFKYANSQLKLLTSPEAKAQLAEDFEAANHIASNGKTYATSRAWKFNSLIYDYKQSHPFEQ